MSTWKRPAVKSPLRLASARRRARTILTTLISMALVSVAHASRAKLVDFLDGVSSSHGVNPYANWDSAVAQAFVTDNSYYRLVTVQMYSLSDTMKIYSSASGLPGVDLKYRLSTTASYRDPFTFDSKSILRPNTEYWLVNYAFGGPTGTGTLGNGDLLYTYTQSGHGQGFIAKYGWTNNFHDGSAAQWETRGTFGDQSYGSIPTLLIADQLGLSSDSPVPISSCHVFGTLWVCPTQGPVSDFWYSALPSAEQTISLTAGAFTKLTTPESAFGYSAFSIIIDGVSVAELTAGDSFDFVAAGYASTSKFNITGLAQGVTSSTSSSPRQVSTLVVNSETPLPLLLQFSGTPDDLTFEGAAAPVPEEPTNLLLLTGGVALVFLRRRVRYTGRADA